MTPAAFQETVLGGIQGLQRKYSTLERTLSNHEQWHQQNKDSLEELTRAKNQFTGLGSQVDRLEIAFKKLRVAVAMESRQAFGDPFERITNDEQKALQLNVAVRRLCNRDGAHFRDFFERSDVKAITPTATPGSTVIDDELARDIYDLLSTFGAWTTLGVVPVGTRTAKLPIQTAYPDAKFVRKLPNSKLADDTTMAGDQESITVELVGVLIKVFLEVLEDAELDYSGQLLRSITQSINARMDHAAFTADGTNDADDCQFTGIFEGGTAVGAASGNTTVETLDYEDFLGCLVGVPEAVHTRMPCWWMHRYQLIRSLAVKDGNGRPIFLTALEAPAPGSIGSILGSPVKLVSQAPSANEASAKVAAFGDPQSYVVAVRRAVELTQSDEFAFDEVARAFRGLARGGFGFRDSTGIAVLSTAAS